MVLHPVDINSVNLSCPAWTHHRCENLIFQTRDPNFSGLLAPLSGSEETTSHDSCRLDNAWKHLPPSATLLDVARYRHCATTGNITTSAGIVTSVPKRRLALVLLEGQRPGTYRRIGITYLPYLEKSSDMFHNAKKRIIELI
jgi:hypothetical protein